MNLLSQLEIEQAEQGGVMDRFLDMHMYITSALQKTDMKAVGLQLALDLLHEKVRWGTVSGHGGCVGLSLEEEPGTMGKEFIFYRELFTRIKKYDKISHSMHLLLHRSKQCSGILSIQSLPVVCL